MKNNRLLLTIGIVLAVIFALWLCVYQVRISEVAVITTFGRITATENQPGAHFKLPPPIQTVHKFDQRIQNSEDKYEESLTQEGNIIMSMVYVGWKVSDGAAFYKNFANGLIPAADRNLVEIVRSAKRGVIGQHPLSDLVSTDERRLKFAEIEQEILKRVQDQINTNNYGMRMEFVGFKKLGFPESVTESVFKQMTSERQTLSSAIESAGQKEATNIINLAMSESARIVNSANANATLIRGEGQALAAKSFEVFQQEPWLAKFLLSLEALESAFKNKATVVLDDRIPPFDILRQGGNTNLFNTK